MKQIFILTSAAFIMLGCAASSQPPLNAVNAFKIDRYLGKWHQIAATPAWFQKECASNTTATYGLAEGGEVSVVNACKRGDGSLMEAEGRARFQGPNDQAKLDVTFLSLLGFWGWFASGDYYVVALDEDYRWSVVGQPSRSYAWILARDQELPGDTLVELTAQLENAGYDTCAVMMSTPSKSNSLCEAARAVIN